MRPADCSVSRMTARLGRSRWIVVAKRFRSVGQLGFATLLRWRCKNVAQVVAIFTFTLRRISWIFLSPKFCMADLGRGSGSGYLLVLEILGLNFLESGINKL